MRQQPSQADRRAGNYPRLNCRILLVEDGPDNQRFISFVLQKAGAKVVVAENGQNALEMVMASHFGRRFGDIKQPFDVILMDMQMPAMDGCTATCRLRENGFTKPIIALTAHAMQSERQRCIEAGCDDYATKPIEKEELFPLIQKHTANKAGQSSLATSGS